MKYGDPEYQRRLELINSIPSNKVDAENLNKYSAQDMKDFEKRHLQELVDQTTRMDADEQMAVAQALNPVILYNALGEHIEKMQQQVRNIKQTISEE